MPRFCCDIFSPGIFSVANAATRASPLCLHSYFSSLPSLTRVKVWSADVRAPVLNSVTCVSEATMLVSGESEEEEMVMSEVVVARKRTLPITG